MDKIRIVLSESKKEKPDMQNVGFGTEFTDHMFLMDYTAERGWFDARIVPYGPLSLSPATAALHYAAEVFEGMKAYRRPDGKVQFFRPQENIKRLNNSADRMGLPKVDEAFMLEAIRTLVAIDQEWVPSEPATSLYIRPFLICNDATVNIHTPNHCLLCIILCPVGSYYGTNLQPVKIMIEQEDVRAVRGGTGYAKCGGNYAASLRAGQRAEKLGYSQVLWLDGVDRKYIEEVGSMNVMFKIDGKIITPALTGSVLPGITRKSCIELMHRWGIAVEERLVSLEELTAAIVEGRLEEAWGCGTAAVISPIGWLYCNDREYAIHDGVIGPFAQKLYDCLTDIQWGKADDPFGWTLPLNK